MVHDRRVGDKTLTMAVSGKVKNGNLVMYDKQTGTLWLQETGDALEGELRRSRLNELPEGQYDPGVRWDEWLERHPESKILHCDHCMPSGRKAPK